MYRGLKWKEKSGEISQNFTQMKTINKNNIQNHLLTSKKKLYAITLREMNYYYKVGDISQEIKIPKCKENIPVGGGSVEFGSVKFDPTLLSNEAKIHLRWLIQKELLKQDVLLIGGFYFYLLFLLFLLI